MFSDGRVGAELIPRGPSTPLAWPGWKQPDIPVKVDRHHSKQAGTRKVVYLSRWKIPSEGFF
jgi:hypothetical protein